jgi:periplasmic divalent cation tolerance protein
MSYIVVLVTSKDTAEAEKIARSVVDKKLAACCSIMKDVHSIYQWEGKVNESREALIVIKTRRDAFPSLEREIKSLHSYKVPEIISLSILGGNEDYLKWLGTSVKTHGPG